MDDKKPKVHEVAAVYEPHPDTREIGFSIHEICRDMWVLGKHYVRPSDDAEWESCPDCRGFRYCTAEQVLGDRYKHCTEGQCFCSKIDPTLNRSIE